MIEDNEYFKTVNAEFPSLGKKIRLFWGNPEFVTLFNELLHEASGIHRVGFPSEVLFALHELEKDHDLTFPQFARPDVNFWNL